MTSNREGPEESKRGKSNKPCLFNPQFQPAPLSEKDLSRGGKQKEGKSFGKSGLRRRPRKVKRGIRKEVKRGRWNQPTRR